MNEFDRMRMKAERYKKEYPPGTRIELISMDDPYAPVEPGTKGTVIAVDDAGNLLMQWDNGRTLSVIPGEDCFHRIPQNEPEQQSNPSSDASTEQDLTSERLDVVEVFGQTALYSNVRIHDSQLPDGLYKYDLRQGGEMAFASMEKVVGVDHAGTLISSQPFDFADDDCIPFDEDSSPNFLGYSMSLEEYMDASFNVSGSEDIGGIKL